MLVKIAGVYRLLRRPVFCFFYLTEQRVAIFIIIEYNISPDMTSNTLTHKLSLLSITIIC